MEREYTISTGWKIFMITVAISLIGFSMFLFSMGEGKSNTALIFLLPFTVLLLGIWIIAQQIRKKIIITDQGITRINAFTTREIAIKDIKGCRVGQKVIVIVPLSANDPKMVINNYDVLKDSDELAKYFKDNFKDKNAEDFENERIKVLQDAKLGTTEADRESTLKKAKRISIAYNIVGAIILFSTIFLDNNKPTVILLLCYPLIGIVIMVLSKGLIKFLSNSKRSVYGFTMLGIFFPGFVLLIKSLFEYTLIYSNNLWLPFLAISLVVSILLYITGINKTVESVKGQAVVMLIAGLIYGFGSTRQLNCLFDNSIPKVIHAAVNDKWIEHSKGTFYHLTINSWDSDPKPKDIEVSKATYERYSSGNTIDVDLKQGLLRIPWLYINE